MSMLHVTKNSATQKFGYIFLLGLLVLVYNSKVAYAVNIIVFGEEGILIFSLYEVNKLRTVVLEKRKDDALIRPRLQFPFFEQP